MHVNLLLSLFHLVHICHCFCRHSSVGTAATTGLPYPSHSDCRSMNMASVNNMALYNIRTHQTTNYDSSSDINLLQAPGGCANRCPSRWPSKHASLEGAYKRGTQTPSGALAVHLDRNLSSGCLECHELFADSGLPLGPSSLSAFPDLGDEEEPSVHTFQTQPKMKDCNKCSKAAASSFAHSASSREVFSSCSCATKEHHSRRSCDMKGHCSCCPYAVKDHCACSHVSGKCCGHCCHCLKENFSNSCSHHQCSASQTPKTKRRHVSPLDTRRRHYSSRDTSSVFWGDKAMALNCHKASNQQKFTHMWQTVENSNVCSSRHHSTNSGANTTLIRSCSVSYDRTSEKDNIPAARSGFSKFVIKSSSRDVIVSRRIESSRHVRSQSVHVASDFSCTNLSVPASLCVGSKLQGSSAS